MTLAARTSVRSLPFSSMDLRRGNQLADGVHYDNSTIATGSAAKSEIPF